MWLDEVTDALPRDPEGALEAALQGWRARRAVESEALVQALGAWVGRGLPALEEVTHEAWMEVAHPRRPADLDRLLASLLTPPANSLRLRLEALGGFAPDPRMGPVLMAMVQTPPTTSSANFGVWTVLFDLLPGCVDTRVADRLTRRAAEPGGSSGFWPKLTKWCTTARDRLVEPVVLPTEEQEVVARLIDRVRELAGAGAPRLRESVAAPPARAPFTGAGLGDALTALEAGDPGRALDALVSVWGTHRDAALAEQIDRLGALIPSEPMPGATAKARHAVWLERARDPRPHEVGALIEGLSDGQAAMLEEKLAAVVRWQPDPRVCRQLETYFQDFMLGARDRLWAAIHDGLVQHADPRRAEAFEARRVKYWGTHPLNRSMTIRKHVRRTAQAWLDALAAKELTSPQRTQVEQIGALVERLASRAGSQGRDDASEEARLVQAVLAEGEGTSALRVYADWLIERGDPRGELIVLEQELLAGKKVKGRRDTLAKQPEVLLGAVGKLLSPYSRRWERGLLVQATMGRPGASGLSATEIAAAATDLRWATLRELTVEGGEELVVQAAPLWGLERLVLSSRSLRALAARTEPLPRVRAVEIRPASEEPAEYEALDGLRSLLPALETVEILIWGRDGDRGVPPARFFQSPCLRGLTLVSGGPGAGGLDDVAAWVERLMEAGSPVPRVEVGGLLDAVLTRQPAGNYAVKANFALYTVHDEPRARASVAGLRRVAPEGLEITWEGTDPWVRKELADLIDGT